MLLRFLFWHQKQLLKRTAHLLTNLINSFDFFVGATKLIQTISNRKAVAGDGDILSFINLFFGSASVLSLLAISLERAHALIWPLHHRVTSTQCNIIGITLVWTGSLCPVVTEIARFLDKIFAKIILCMVVNSTLLVSLFVVVGSYLPIKKRLRSPALSMQAQTKKT